eukprot:Colp12_sorted_trinity150504_noHs@32542
MLTTRIAKSVSRRQSVRLACRNCFNNFRTKEFSGSRPHGVRLISTQVIPSQPRFLKPLLSESQEKIIQRERSLLQQVIVLQTQLNAPQQEVDLLTKNLKHIEELFLLVIVGEFNSGKSSFINALLGAPVSATGPTPTTAKINIIKYGPHTDKKEVITVNDDDGEKINTVTVDVGWLQRVNVVDTPGTNAITREHERLTLQFVPRSDLIVFVTSADRAFTESERAFFSVLQGWRKKVIVVINKVDTLEDSKQAETVSGWVGESILKLFNFRPPIFSVSAKAAFDLKTGKATKEGLGPMAQIGAEGFSSLEGHIHGLLDSAELLHLKLSSPLGVLASALDNCGDQVAARMNILETDMNTLQSIDEQVELHHKDVQRELKYQCAKLENVVHEYLERGDRFLESRLTVRNILGLLNTEGLRAAYADEVVGTLVRDVDAHVNFIMSWIVDKNHRQWRSVRSFINQQATHETKTHFIGQFEDFGEEWDHDPRHRVIQEVRDQVTRMIDTYDHKAEARRLAEEVKDAVAKGVVVNLGALGLGALASALLVDFSGLVVTGTLAAAGLVILPSAKRRLKSTLREKARKLRAELTDTATKAVTAELEANSRRVESTVAPYRRFVTTDRERLLANKQACASAWRELNAIRDTIETEFGRAV